MVRDEKPDFLNKNMKLTLQQNPIKTVKDITSQMAELARRGSRKVLEFRQQAEIEKQKKIGDLAGTKMGKLLGVEEKPKE